MTTYHGYRLHSPASDGESITTRVTVIVRESGRTRLLNPRLDLANKSPDGFEWGYGGSGPSQLALALVADCCGDNLAVASIYQRVKWAIVARLPRDGWTLSEDDVRQAVEAARLAAGRVEAGDGDL